MRELTAQELSELEQKAMRGEVLPEGLDAPSRALYISLRGLYYQYRVKILDREQAKREKALILQDYRSQMLGEKCREKSIEAWKRLPTDAYKCDCPECKRIIGIILGLE